MKTKLKALAVCACGTHGPSSSTVWQHRAIEYAFGPDPAGPWVRGS